MLNLSLLFMSTEKLELLHSSVLIFFLFISYQTATNINVNKTSNSFISNVLKVFFNTAS